MAVKKEELDALEGFCREYKMELLTVAMMGGDWIDNYEFMAGIKDELLLTTLVMKKVAKPWKVAWNPKETTANLIPRTLKVRKGQIEELEVPVNYRNSWLGKKLQAGIDSMDNPIERELLTAIVAQLNEDIYLDALWGGVYDAEGTDPVDLFDGFNRIIDVEIAAGKISATPDNTNKLKWPTLYPTGAIDATNAVDKLKKFYRDCVRFAKAMKRVKMDMYISTDIYDFYCDDYQATHGSLPYNTQYEKIFLEGSRGLVTLLAEPAQDNENRIVLTQKSNLIYGVDLESDQEDLLVRRDNNPKQVQIFGEFVAGVQIGTLQGLFVNE
jgi:hypothetical protein